MYAIKTIKVKYEPNEQLQDFFRVYRNMVNYCIKEGLKRNISSRFRLITILLQDFKELFPYHTHYRLSACEIAVKILKNYRKMVRRNPDAKLPRVRKLFLKLDNQSFWIEEGYLKIPIKPREFLNIKLVISDFHKQFLNDVSLKLGSVTVNQEYVILPFRKDVELKEQKSILAMDVNEKSLDCVLTKDNRYIPIKFDLSEIKRIHYTYFKKRKQLQEKLQKKSTILKEKLTGLKNVERNRIQPILHKVSKRIADIAADNNSLIILEDLSHIRSYINKKQKYAKILKRRLNAWNFHKLQEYIEYKSLWLGISTVYVNPKNTSRTCPICGWCRKDSIGSNGLFICEKCDWKFDRDLNACLNLIKTQDGGRRFSPNELLMRNDLSAMMVNSNKANPFNG